MNATIEYAVSIASGSPYFERETDLLAINTDPAVPYRKLQTIPKGHYDSMLVQREGACEWEPVNSMDLQWIALLAEHEILKDHLYGRGIDGWIRCTCGWRADIYDLGNHSRVKAQAEKHMTEVKERVDGLRDSFTAVVRQVSDPVQANCPHRDTKILDDFGNPDLKTWHCRDCDRRVQFVPSAVGKAWAP